MGIMKVTDTERNVSNIVYMYTGLSEALSGSSRNFSTYKEGSRSVLEIDASSEYSDIIRCEIEDKIADIVAVNYKYSFFLPRIRPYGLTETENGVLLSALISADIDEDQRFRKRKISSDLEYSVDGLFNFRLGKLRSKWEDVIAYVPKTFDAEKLKDFIAFIMDEKAGVRVFAENGKVYDRHFRRMSRTLLTGREYGEDKLLNEILLSGAGEAELLSPVSGEEEELLKEYLGSKIIFGKNYFSDTNV